MKINFVNTYTQNTNEILNGDYEIKLLKNEISLISGNGKIISLFPDTIRSSKMKVVKPKALLLESEKDQKILLIIRIPDAIEWVFMLLKNG